MDSLDLQSILKGRQAIFEYLFRAFYKVPDVNFIENSKKFASIFNLIAFESNNQDTISSAGLFDRYVNSISPEAEVLSLNAEFTALFVMGSQSVELTESKWISSIKSKNDIILSISNYFAEHNISKPTEINWTIDSYSSELFYMFKMSMKTTESFEQSLIAAQQGFLNTHLLAWTDQFTNDVVTFCDQKGFSPFYKSIALFANSYLHYDKLILEELNS